MKRYKAIEVVQQSGARPMYMIACPAREMLEWCDVPRTKENYMAGYQRVLAEGRAKDISDYLQQAANNALPGAIIVAADSDYVSVINDGGQLYLEVKDDTRTFTEKLQELFGAFTTRLSGEELASADINFTAFDGDDHTSEAEEPKSYLAALAKELEAAVTDFDSLPKERRQAIEDYIAGVSKPGLIIDGQHRVIGAARVEHDVTLPVVVMRGLEHQEQVFQFYVLNSKAKPLKPTELRRIISTSLTDAEINALYQRFRETKLDAEEARWTFEMNTSQNSVFRGLIDFGFGSAGEVIPENVADQLVRAFMKAPRSKYASLQDSVKKRWEDPEARLSIFFDFWRAIRETYSEAWDDAIEAAKDGKKNQLFMKVALITLQQFLLDRFVTALPYRSKGAPAPFANAESIAEMVKSTLENLPAKFFTMEWKAKQMDTSAGREMLYDNMSKAWDNQGKNLGNLKLFKP